MDNYFVVQKWMVKELGLKGNERDVFAIIYGFSQDGESKFTGSRQYLADMIGCSVRCISDALDSLVEKELIIKENRVINGLNMPMYYVGKICMGSEKSAYPLAESAHNNISIINKEKISSKEDIEKKPEKHTYGKYQHVKLTDKEYDKLQEEFGNAEELVNYLDECMEMKGYKYKSCYLAIRNWVVDAVEKKHNYYSGGKSSNGFNLRTNSNDSLNTTGIAGKNIDTTDRERRLKLKELEKF